MTIRERVEQIVLEENPNALFLDGFDDAIVGIVRRINLCLVAYNGKKCIEILMEQGMEYEDACDYFTFNVSGSYVGEHTPVFIEQME